MARGLSDMVRDEADRIVLERGGITSTRSVEHLERENTQLRELAEKAWKAAEMLCQAWCGPCRADGVSITQVCPMNERDEECVYGQLQRDLRDLGVEVDA